MASRVPHASFVPARVSATLAFVWGSGLELMHAGTRDVGASVCGLLVQLAAAHLAFSAKTRIRSAFLLLGGLAASLITGLVGAPAWPAEGIPFVAPLVLVGGAFAFVYVGTLSALMLPRIQQPSAEGDDFALAYASLWTALPGTAMTPLLRTTPETLDVVLGSFLPAAAVVVAFARVARRRLWIEEVRNGHKEGWRLVEQPGAATGGLPRLADGVAGDDEAVLFRVTPGDATYRSVDHLEPVAVLKVAPVEPVGDGIGDDGPNAPMPPVLAPETLERLKSYDAWAAQLEQTRASYIRRAPVYRRGFSAMLVAAVACFGFGGLVGLWASISAAVVSVLGYLMVKSRINELALAIINVRDDAARIRENVGHHGRGVSV